ncbi:TIR domain-containing protein [Nocardiopsis sp. CT-R113]|uniref:TIR domain-containing protein n=1 Tax=Nocardiopsis codii TaxID=3065942 RepID=A0ABU7K1H2_9ACTN|nr:TIR domain-containing protein [Nocardiopsis sp. CT-R113]MEE2036111.1 TIR domain-containing protein [Nocardiopsis sp. CT-R113]
MAKTVFFSFHYQRDVHRVQLVRQINALEGQPLLNSQTWEEVRRQGSAAIQKWIDDQMAYKKAVIVLVGKETAERPWVKYEIERAWSIKKPLLGVRIHGISSMGDVDGPGANPFEKADIDGGQVPLFDPTAIGLSGKINSQATYGNISRNLTSWSEQGATR